MHKLQIIDVPAPAICVRLDVIEGEGQIVFTRESEVDDNLAPFAVIPVSGAEQEQ